MKTIARGVPHAVVCAASMGVMIVELVASRLVSKYLGSSLYTWTSVIGIVLGGISLGNWIGGKLADRFAPRRIVPLLLLSASVLTCLIIVLDMALGRITGALGTEGMTAAALARSILLIAVLFLLPSCALGTISPVMAKYALEETAGVGRTVGGIYAAGSLGSIGGTFLAGYLLIPALGLTLNILIVGIGLALLSLLMGGRRIVSGAWAAALAVLALTGAPDSLARSLGEDASGSRTVYEKDSPYSWIRVADRPAQFGTERTLRLDALIHNMRDPARPDVLLYEYERIFESLTRAKTAGRTSFSTLTLGGGGFTLPAYLERNFPDARHTVVEIDPDVVETAHAYFGVPRDTRISISVADARSFVSAVRGRRTYDIVYCDVFNAFSVPPHLTTREFTAMVRDILAPDGMYLVNCIDILDSGRFLDAFIATVTSVFPRVSIYAPPALSASARTTFVVAAGGIPGAEALRAADGSVAGERVPAEMLAGLHARRGGVVLTDDRSPVETLMAPVFLRSVK